MAKSASPTTGGKLALFEVLNASPDGGGGDVPAASQSRPSVPPPVSRPTSFATPSMNANVVNPAAARPAEARSGGGLLNLRADPAAGRFGVETGLAGIAFAALAVAGVAGLAFAAGRMSAPDAVAALDEAAPMPEVMDVAPPAARATDAPAAARLAAVTSPDVAVSTTPLPTAAVGDGERKPGQNYVLVQSYHRSERDRAEATVAAIRAAGLGATIEEGIPGWSSRLCVFGTRGFGRITDNPEYQRYVADLLKVSNAHRRDAAVKRFDPQPVRWGR